MPITPSQLSSILRVKKEFSLITGAITLTDLTPWAGYGIIAPDTAAVLLKLVAPTGVVVYQNAGYDTDDFSAPDFDLSTSTLAETMPTDVNGDYITGTYTLYIKAQVGDDTVILPTVSNIYTQATLSSPQNDFISISNAVNGYTLGLSIDGIEPISFVYDSNLGDVSTQFVDAINNYIAANPLSYWAQNVSLAAYSNATSFNIVGLYNGILGGGNYSIQISDIGVVSSISQLPTISLPIENTFSVNGGGSISVGDSMQYRYNGDFITYTAQSVQTASQATVGFYNAIQSYVTNNPSSPTATEWTFQLISGNIVATYFQNNQEVELSLSYQHGYGASQDSVTSNIVTSTAEVCNCTTTVTIDIDVDYATAVLTSTDTTSYGAYSSISRTHTIYPPPISGLPNQTTSATTNVYSNIVTTTWSVEISSDVTYLKANDTYTTCRLTGSKEVVVEADTLCATLCLLKKFRTDFYAKYGKKCVDDMEKAYNLAMDEFLMAWMATRCGRPQSEIQSYINKIYDITGIDPDCDCGCSASDYPTPVVPTSIINGSDGTDGVTPQFQNTGTWIQVSYDEGNTWSNLFSLASVTGAAGANGTNGTDGADGVAVLYNEFPAQATTVNGNWETLETYTVPAAQLDSNGSDLVILATFTTPSWTSATQNTRITFNGNTLVDTTMYAGFYSSNIEKLVYNIRITRTSNTTANVQLTVDYVATNNATAARGNQPLTSLAGLNFTTTTYDIDADAYSAVNGDIVLENLEVIYYKK